jgi:hypothetical protein
VCADVAAPFVQAVPVIILVPSQTEFRGVGYGVFDCVAWLPAQDLKVLYFPAPYAALTRELREPDTDEGK